MASSTTNGKYGTKERLRKCSVVKVVVVKAWYCVVSPGGEGGIIYILIADRASTGR